ncbi:polysaccharide biosynthesis tyrosine autokinase [Kocuria sp. LUK]|uniref:polysaccharide biosynthesis tyrosine autokinase n=1 Tax=Kocuria sp. LUK TaxID=2897828 RepID=UPI001E36FDF3|nr:polysaccharide biosynthesis tyrosine autokinase [Kocuria sp. LUK]MCD1144952.1 polysaccharide biosynthesis tyrosine autokinase [Kocuria sp. LUK]
MEHTDAERQAPALDARDLLRLVRNHWRGITLITLLSTLLALGWTLLQPKVYSATASGLVVTVGEQDLASALAGENLAQSKAVSYESLATSRPVAEAVVDELGLDATPEQVLQRVTANVPLDTTEIRVTTEALDPTESADLANAWVVALAEQVQELETGGDDEDAINRVAVQPLSNASLPLAPSSPNTKLNLALGLVGGLGLGLLYAFARWKMDRRIRSVEEVRETFGTPVLGIIPEDDRLADHREIIETGTSGGRGHHAFSEALRELRTNLSFVSVDAPPRVVVVTSSMPGEGKSSITANLAVAIASTGRDVVVVDGDLRRPVMTELFGLVPGVGITDVLVGEAEVDDVLQVYDKFPNLQVLGAGRTPPNPTELLASQAMRTMLAGLAEDAFVLVDAPPLLPVTDAALLTASADGALVVATAQGTTVDELGKALGNIEQVRGRVLGVVLNHVPTTGADAGFYGYYGKSYYASDDSGEDAPEAPLRPAKEIPAAGTAAPAAAAPDTGSTAVLDTESPADPAVSDLPADEAERFDLAAWQRPGKGTHRA